MNLHPTLSGLTITVTCALLLAVAAGCTGPPRGSTGNTTVNSTQSGDLNTTNPPDENINTTSF